MVLVVVVVVWLVGGVPVHVPTDAAIVAADDFSMSSLFVLSKVRSMVLYPLPLLLLLFILVDIDIDMDDAIFCGMSIGAGNGCGYGYGDDDEQLLLCTERFCLENDCRFRARD